MMTVEHKIILGFDDLTSIIFECRNTEKNCRSRVSVSPDKTDIPATCPSCGIEWVRHPQSETTVKGTAFSVLAGAIADVRKKHSDPWPKFRILLEFDEPKRPVTAL